MSSGKKIKKIVTICGGNGGFSLLRGLKKFDWEVSAIVNMTDDGGSTGRLIKELGVLPPGDVRYCLSALSMLGDDWEKLLNYRFEKGGLKGHTAGNILLAGLEKFHGSFLYAVRELEKILHVKGRVVPAMLESVELCMLLNNRKTIKGEDAINKSVIIQKAGFKKLYLHPKVKANPKAITEILAADVVLIGPGNIYCSILPSLIIPDIKKAILKTKALVIFNCNLVNRKGHTDGFDLTSYADLVNKHLGRNRVDAILFNSTPISDHTKKRFHIKEADLVKINNGSCSNFKIFQFPVLETEEPAFSKTDEIAYLRSPIRHNGEKVGRAVIEIYNKLRKQ
jgi:uncharacterized cofD-like protein